jgi:hypothetical protein
MRLAVAGAFVLLCLLLAAFNPLLALAVAAGLLLGLVVRWLWRSRGFVLSRWPLWLSLGILAVLVVFFVVGRTGPRFGVPAPPVTVTPRYEGTAEQTGSAWRITDRVLFSPELLMKLADLAAPPIDDEVVEQLRRTLASEFIVLPSSGRVEISASADTSPRRFKEVVDYLERYASLGRWSVHVSESFGRDILLVPSLRSAPDQGRSQVSQSLTTQLARQGWTARQVNDLLVFSHDRQEETNVRWFPATTSQELRITLPDAITLPNGREVLLAPDEGSLLTLSSPPHLVAATLPTAKREAAARKETLTIVLDPAIGEQSTIEMELLSPVFRNQVGLAIRDLSFSGMAKWIVLAAAAVGAEEIKRLLLMVARAVQRRAHIPTPGEGGSQNST